VDVLIVNRGISFLLYSSPLTTDEEVTFVSGKDAYKRFNSCHIVSTLFHVVRVSGPKAPVLSRVLWCDCFTVARFVSRVRFNREDR
jgi:hypothetical protein